MGDAAHSRRPRQEPESESDIVDTSKLSLLELIESDDHVIGDSLRRILAELDRPRDTIASWGNVVRWHACQQLAGAVLDCKT
jgi:hypothetical protein